MSTAYDRGMSRSSAERPLLRVAFFGMRCAFSVPPLSALIGAGHQIAAVLLPGPPFGPPILPKQATLTLPLLGARQAGEDIEAEAARAGAAVLNVSDLRHPQAIAALVDLEPDLIATACFPALLPPEVLQLPSLGCLNVHPSLLPRGRGPEPLFWTFRRGELETGVTIHLMDKHFDAGPVVLQETITVPPGIRLPEFERQLAELGGTLLVQAIAALAAGHARPVPQDDSQATSAPIPGPADYEVPTNLPATWAYNFARAVAAISDQLRVVVMETKEQIRVADAVAVEEGSTLATPYLIAEDHIDVRFRPGSVTFVLPSSS